MKDSEFTELLNLYLDHEISAADAARLEAEVQSNPNRRRVYQEYCRMQKACKLLAQDFASESTAEAEQKIIAFDEAATRRHTGGKAVYIGGLLAAAACVAVVFVRRSHESNALATAGTPVVVQTATPAPTAAVPTEPAQLVAATATPANHGIERRSADALSLRNAQTNALTINVNAQNDPHFAWIQDVRLTPIQAPTPIDQLRFDATANLRSDNRTYTNTNKPLQSDVPWTAIRFQK